MIEINREKSLWVYRISPINACQIDWRFNRHGARWRYYMVCDTPEAARRALLTIEGEEGK